MIPIISRDNATDAQPGRGRTLSVLAGAILLMAIIYFALGQTSWAMPSQQDLRSTIVAELRGHVALQGRPAPPDPSWSIPVQLELETSGGQPYTSTVVTTDNSGFFLLPSVDEGSYTIFAKGFHTLRVRKDNVQVLAPYTNVEMGVLAEGDANNDNTINAIDASILATSYWKAQGDVGFDPRADLNEDGVIDARDASLMATNYWQSGQ
jgi:hypothetical protein